MKKYITLETLISTSKLSNIGNHYTPTCIYDVLCDLVPFVKFKKHEKRPWRSVTFTKVACNFTKITLLRGCFSRFLNCTYSTKSRNASYIYDA